MRVLVRIGSLSLAAFCALLLIDVQGRVWHVLEGALLTFAALTWLVEAVASLYRRRRGRPQRE